MSLSVFVTSGCYNTSYSYCCWTTCSKLMLCQLMVYGGGVVVGSDDNSDNDMGGGIGGGDC